MAHIPLVVAGKIVVGALHATAHAAGAHGAGHIAQEVADGVISGGASKLTQRMLDGHLGGTPADSRCECESRPEHAHDTEPTTPMTRGSFCFRDM